MQHNHDPFKNFQSKLKKLGVDAAATATAKDYIRSNNENIISWVWELEPSVGR
jgi:hypothetical protein